MSPKVYEAFRKLVHENKLAQVPDPKVIEIGAGSVTLLDLFPETAERIALNPIISKELELRKDIQAVKGTSYSIPSGDSSVDVVMSCSVLEHDKYFWKSLEEIKRVLKNGGVFIVGVPAYQKLPWDFMNTTFTYKRHGFAYNADFYRFSEQCVRELLLENFQNKSIQVVRRWPNPYIVASGVK